MTLLSRLRSWIRTLLRRDRLESEMRAELRFHVEARMDDLVKSGVPREDAMRRARIEFGSIERASEECRHARGIDLVEDTIQDFRYAVRTQRRSYAFTAVAVPTLALGIGAATAIFSVVKAVILNPLPFHQPGRLVHLWEGNSTERRYRPGDQPYFSTVRPGYFYDWRAQSQSFEKMSTYRSRSMLLTGGERAELVVAQEVTDEFFETLGTPAQLGRTLGAADYHPNSGRVAVISHRMWTARFANDPAVIGRQISLDRESCAIVGVMPAGFYPTPPGYAPSPYPDLWIPHWANQGEKDDFKTWGLIPVARLKPGLTWEQAQTELDVISERIAKAHPQSKIYTVVVPMDAQLIGSSWKLLLLLAGGITLLLLIACVNIANLLLARAVEREKEFAIRTALGAERRRLMRQLFTESLVFAIAAGALAVGVAFAGTRGLLAWLPKSVNLPRLDSVRVDLGVLAFVCGLTLAASLFFSLVPLLRSSTNRPHDALKLEGRGFSAGKSNRRLGQIFIVSEFVLSLVLLILGVLLVQSLLRLQRVDPGFDASNLLTLRIEVPQANYGKWVAGEKNAPREKLYERLEQIVSAVPGVESVALGGLPFQHEFNPWGVDVEGRQRLPDDTRGAGIQWVNPGFFHTLGLRLLSGRFFEERDNANDPNAAVVNETFARTFFPNEDPIGKRVTVWFAKTTIVGVVADFKVNSLDRKPYPAIFWSVRQIPGSDTSIMVRTKIESSSLAGVLRQKIQDFDPDLPVLEIRPMTEVIADSLWRKRLPALLIGLVAVLAVTLAGAGVYSVMSYSVSQRRKEVGIRIAFGANRRHVFGLVMGETCRLAFLGSVLGCLAAVAVGRLTISISYLAPSLASNLLQETLNPVAFVLSPLFLFGVALLASFVPARRALRVDPMLALQHE